MGRKKPLVPKKRVGTHYVDVTKASALLSAYASDRAASDASSNMTVITSAVLAAPVSTPTTASSTPSTSPLTTATTTAATSSCAPTPVSSSALTATSSDLCNQSDSSLEFSPIVSSAPSIASASGRITSRSPSPLHLAASPTIQPDERSKPKPASTPSFQPAQTKPKATSAHVSCSPSVQTSHAPAEPQPAAETITVSVAELEKWRRQLIMEVEDYHSNEQLKRIAEFGRVHAALLEEAKAHVRSVELQLRQQLELEVARIRQSAQEQLRAMQRENELLRAQLVAMRAAAEDTQPDSPMMSVCDSDEPSATTESGVEDV